MTAPLLRPDKAFRHNRPPVGQGYHPKQADCKLYAWSPGWECWEEFTATSMGDGRYELVCVPFTLNGYTLGDTVEATAQTDGLLVAARVHSPSDHHGFRICFPAGQEPLPEEARQDRSRITRELADLACKWEWVTPHCIALAAPYETAAQVQRAIALYGQVGSISNWEPSTPERPTMAS